MNISNSNVKVKIQFAVNCIYYYFSELFFQATRDILDNCVPPTLWQQFQEDPHTCGVMIQSKYFWPYSVLWVIKCRALDPKTSLLIIFILNQIPAHLNVYFAHLVMHYYCDLCTTHLYSPLWMYWKGNPNSEIYIHIFTTVTYVDRHTTVIHRGWAKAKARFTHTLFAACMWCIFLWLTSDFLMIRRMLLFCYYSYKMA